MVSLTGTQRLYGNRWEAAKKIKDEIFRRFGLPSAVGIGDNKYLAKCALDLYAKKNEEGIAEISYQDVPDLLWPHLIKDTWGIGSALERKLHGMGIRTLEHLAKYLLKRLQAKFGIMGEQLWNHAWGIDESPHIGHTLFDQQKAFGSSATLLRDYYKYEEIHTALLEMTEETARRCRKAGVVAGTVHLSIGYTYSHGGGFNRSRTLDEPSNMTSKLFSVVEILFNENFIGVPVRFISVSVSKLTKDDGIQLNLFEDNVKERSLSFAMDAIREKHGPTSLLRACSYTSGGIIRERSEKIVIMTKDKK
ncbi:DNA polymerase thumb domain-containing protein [Aneurinibacillus migulanus]|uniref:DinB/UmuC family translesion DNA polymerase n=1 Tax=Aneurinibacillus migulanus TaxID=47500 RepID=UPI0006991B4E|nr:hypothetical protein [Aneurinibacillus migulanus]CEH31338.1 Nucleotidyltransferase/DNA polymerase involved in DNA repair [Aneurinibacillus migulanus]